MKENSFVIEGNKMLFDGKVFLVFDDIIQDFIISDDSIIVLVDAAKSHNNQNIYCYDFNGKLRWRIPPPDKLHFQNYYTSMYLSEDDFLQAYNINGVEVTVDKQNGNILKKELIK